MDTCISGNAFEKLHLAFPERLGDLPSLDNIQRRVAALSGTTYALYDCCRNSCCCFVGPNLSRTHCPYCQSPRYHADGRAVKQFMYFPVIPRLKSMATNKQMSLLMAYRKEFQPVPGTYRDVFDGTHYQQLRGKSVSSGAGGCRELPIFGDGRDVALALSVDGFCPFKRRKQSCWPIILFNLNLPPDIRFHLEHILCVGVIPGPKAVKDIDSFLYPLVEELLKLEKGVSAYDILSDSMFTLRAFLILVFGDMPAVAKLMRMKGHNGKSPCRACHILGIRVPNSDNPSHYTPLHRSFASDQPSYDPLHLPRRTHEQFLAQIAELDSAPSTSEAERLSSQYGIKGRPILSHLATISLPQSFPHDFMHLVWENLIPNLLRLWTSTFNSLNTSASNYYLPRSVQDAVAAAAAPSGDTIPAAFSCRVPNFVTSRFSFTAESWSFWGLYLGPVLLRGRFKKEKYYKHFIKLVRLLHTCLKFSISIDEIQHLREGFASWVLEYEK